MTLSQLIEHEAIIAQLAAEDRDGVIRELVGALVSSGAVPQDYTDVIIKSIIDREKKGSTGFGKGVAIPHVKHKSVDRAVAAIGNSQKGIDFRSLDGQPVHSVVLLISPDSADQHLAAMNLIWPNLNSDRFRRFLRQARTREEIVELLADAQAGGVR